MRPNNNRTRTNTRTYIQIYIYIYPCRRLDSDVAYSPSPHRRCASYRMVEVASNRRAHICAPALCQPASQHSAHIISQLPIRMLVRFSGARAPVQSRNQKRHRRHRQPVTRQQRIKPNSGTLSPRPACADERLHKPSLVALCSHINNRDAAAGWWLVLVVVAYEISPLCLCI